MLNKREFLACSALASIFPTPTRAQLWPSRNVIVSVSLAAGTGLDIIVRLCAEKLAIRLGRPFIVENKPGARQMLAANTVTKAEPDGHSLAVVTVSLLAIGPSLFKDFRFTPTRDFTTVSVYLQSAFVLVASPALGLSDLNSLVARAKGQGQQPLSYSSLGPGSAQHLSMELVKQLLGFEMIHVPYTSTPQSVLDIVGGSVSCGFIEAATAIPLVREGKLSGLAVSTSTSLPELPDVPPIAVAARVPGLEYVGWHAVIAHAATPKPIVERLNGEMNAIMTEGDMRQRLATLGLAPMKAMNLEETRDYVIAEQRKWGEVVRKLGLEGSQ